MFVERIQEVLPGRGVVGSRVFGRKAQKNSDFMMGLIMVGSSCLMLSWTLIIARGRKAARPRYNLSTLDHVARLVVYGVWRKSRLIFALDCSSGAMRLSFQEEGNAWGANLSNKLE